MPSFIITDKASGKKYKVTGPSKERALEVWRKKQATGELDAVAKPKATVNPDTMQPEGVPAFVPRDKEGKPLAGYDAQTGTMGHSKMEQTGAFTTAATDAVPIVGPYLTKGVNKAAAALVTPFSGNTFAENEKEISGYGPEAQANNPGYALGGRITGTVAPMLALGSTALGARALGITGNSLGARVLASGASNALISGGDTAVRGGDPSETLTSAITSGGIGAAIPLAGSAINALGSAVGKTVGPRLNSIIRPAQEAGRRVNAAIDADRNNLGAYPTLSASDEAAASLNSQPVINVDRGGETTRALARSAANNDPEARGLFIKTADDRFASQGERAASFIDRLSGGQADSQAAHDALQASAQRANKPAYDAAMKAKGAQNMDSPELLGLLASPAIRDAAMAAETRGANRAVAEGFKPVKNPFAIDSAGNVSLRDPKVKPTLAFWDQVKRNLDAKIGTASREGDKPLVADLTALKTKLVGALDAAVPEYQTARQGAAAFFGAEDALDAGKKFVTMNMANADTARALAKMKPAERNLFAIGFASQMKEAIKATPDRTNVIKKIFGSEQAREKIRMALGTKNFHEFEQFVKVENAMDTLRGAMGNSKTAQYLIEAGMAGTGAGVFTGDWKKGIGAAIITGIVRKYGGRVDDRMSKQIAQLLLSEDPTALQRAAMMAASNPVAAQAVEDIQSAIGAALRGAGADVSRPDGGALSGHPRITVNHPNNTPVPAQ